MSSHSLQNSCKRPRVSLDSFAPKSCHDFSIGVSHSCCKRRGIETSTPQREISSLLSSSSSREQPSSISSFSAVAPAKQETGFSSLMPDEVPVLKSSCCASELSDTADSSTTISPFLSTLPREGPSLLQRCPGCASSDQEAQSCCDGNGESEVDVTSFLLHEVWEGANSDGGEAFAFNPETVFLNSGASAATEDCSEVDAFMECSAENGNWFLNDLEGEGGHVFLNEVLDQEWMAAAVENLDRINDILDTNLCVLHLFESDQADKEY